MLVAGFITILNHFDSWLYRNIELCWLLVLLQYVIMLVAGFITQFNNVGCWLYRNI
jgi:hypothetical protein